MSGEEQEKRILFLTHLFFLYPRAVNNPKKNHIESSLQTFLIGGDFFVMRLYFHVAFDSIIFTIDSHRKIVDEGNNTA